MGDPLANEETAAKYLLTSSKAATTLFESQLYGHFLVVVYSTIDTVGLLWAPPGIVSASSRTFKPWVEQFMLPQLEESLSAADLWAARCAVLHTYSTVSDLSRSGKARQLQYYLGDRGSSELARFVEITNRMEDGAHVAVHLGGLGAAFGSALIDFVPVLIERSNTCPATSRKLRDVMQVFPA